MNRLLVLSRMRVYTIRNFALCYHSLRYFSWELPVPHRLHTVPLRIACQITIYLVGKLEMTFPLLRHRYILRLMWATYHGILHQIGSSRDRRHNRLLIIRFASLNQDASERIQFLPSGTFGQSHPPENPVSLDKLAKHPASVIIGFCSSGVSLKRKIWPSRGG